ncbi:MAG: hypothetical protein JWR69_1984 [Pedosphaera sp.]|nr:hypothetical protein [Pedosphaera sp.]
MPAILPLLNDPGLGLRVAATNVLQQIDPEAAAKAGMQPGKQFGTFFDEAFEAQLEGAFTDLDGALKWLDGRN